ncbi:MAG: DUF2286 domain-containing protein [Acidilobus sp.]
MKVLTIRAERGKIIKSEVVDGNLKDLVKRKAQEAMNEWDPETSDFIVLKDNRELELPLPLKPELVDLFRSIGNISRTKDKAIGSFPVYTISFENRMLSEDKYVEYKIYLLAPYINDDVKTELEAEAQDITTEKEGPEGIEEEGEEEEKES